MPSVLWRCWLGGRKGIRPVKKLSGGVLAWFCLELGADLHMAQLIPLLLTVSCFSKIQIGFTFLVLAHPGSPGQRAIKQVCVISGIWLVGKAAFSYYKCISDTRVLLCSEGRESAKVIKSIERFTGCCESAESRRAAKPSEKVVYRDGVGTACQTRRATHGLLWKSFQTF